MADLAMLEVGFDPTPLKDGVRSLEAVVTTAKKAEAATTSFGKGIEQAGQRVATGAKAMERVTASIAKIEKAIQSEERAMGQMGAGMSKAAQQMMAAETAAAGMADEIARVGAAGTAAATGMTQAAAGMQTISVRAQAANQNVGLASHQVTNLRSQILDMGTMLASGSSPMQVLSTQSAQVYEALAGNGGLKAGLVALGVTARSAAASVVAALGPIGLTIAGATAAAGALWYMLSGSNEARSAEDSLKAYEKLIARLENGFGGAADAAKKFFDAATKGSAEGAIADTRKAVSDLERDLKAAIGALGNNKDLDFQINPFRGRGLSAGRQEIQGLFLDLRAGIKTAEEFDREMARIQMDPAAEKSIRDFAAQIRVADDGVQSLAAQLGAARMAAEELNKIGGKGMRVTTSPNAANPFDLSERFGGGNPLADRLDPQSYDALRDGLKAQREELTKAATEVDKYADAVRGQRSALDGSLDALRLQVDTFGQSEGAIAAATFKLDAMREAQEAATDAGRNAIDPALVDQINRQAAEYGALTDRLQANTVAQREQQKAAEDVRRQQERVADFAADLQFERSIATLPEAEQDVRQSLHRLGVDFDSYEGQRLAAGMRYNAALEEQQDTLRKTGDVAKDVLGGMIDALSQGGDLVGNLISAFAGLGKQLATGGLDRIMGGIFGGKTGQAGGGGIAGGIASALGSLSGSQSIATPTSRPEFVGQAAAAVSGQVMTYAKRFNSGVDSRLMTILETAAQRFPGYRVEAISGLASRPGNRGFHPKGMAADVQIYDQSGRALGNYQNAADFRVYEKLAQVAKGVQQELFPALDKLFTFGGYLQGPKGKYGALDSMHLDLGGANRMQGGSWANGLTAKQRAYFPGVQSSGMADVAYRQTSSIDEARALRKGVSEGMVDANHKIASAYDRGGYDSSSPRTAGAQQGMSRGQAVIGGIAGIAGIAANGYQSGSPISGGLSGAMGGLELGGSIASAFPSLAGVAGPAGMAIGAAAGCIGGEFGTRQRRAA